MMIRRAFAAMLVTFGAASLTACPPMTEATRDGGTTCSSIAQCNPAGMTCGAIRQCVAGYCTDTTTVVACADGGYPDSGPTGNCATYEDCNPAPACGNVIACINFVCDPSVRLDIPCRDASSNDASTDATSETGPGDASD